MLSLFLTFMQPRRKESIPWEKSPDKLSSKLGSTSKRHLDKPVRATGAQFTTFYCYTIMRVNSIGFDGEGLKEISKMRGLKTAITSKL